MWVSTKFYVQSLINLLNSSAFLQIINSFTHKVNSLNTPLTWAYLSFPHVNPLVTTTTYTYIKTPVRFPLVDLLKNQLLKIETCKVEEVREG